MWGWWLKVAHGGTATQHAGGVAQHAKHTARQAHLLTPIRMAGKKMVRSRNLWTGMFQVRQYSPTVDAFQKSL
jgi:hypothetical protein